MSISNDILTASALLGPMAAMLWFFFRRWIERMERIETKIDKIMEDRALFISRDEYERGITRVHERIDKHLKEDHMKGAA